MLARGIILNQETVRRRCAKLAQTYANGLRRHRALPGVTWHLDEMLITINGPRRCRWRAVSQAARRRLLRSAEHRQSTYLNNRAENSHQPTRKHEDAMKKSTPAEHTQRFLPAFRDMTD